MPSSHKNHKTKLLLIAIFLLIALVASAAMFNVQAYNLPEMGSSTEMAISQQDEKLLGEYIYQDLATQIPIVQNAFLGDYIQSLGDKLLKNSQTSYDKFHFFLINSPEINAFALPGGYIGINKGLITAAESESEVAAVIAHEISHVTQRHIARSFEKQSQMQLPMMAGIVAGALLAAYNPELGQSVIMGSMAAGNQSLINYTRSNEAEADRIGIMTLANSGYSPYSMAQMFGKLERYAYADKEFYPEYLRTHPVNGNRIADARSRADKITSKTDPVTIFNDFELVKNILLTDSSLNLAKIIDNNQAIIAAQKDSKTNTDQENLYKFNYGYALIKNHDYKKSHIIFAELHTAYPTNNIIVSLLAESLKNNAEAAKVLDLQLARDKNNIPLSIQYSKNIMSLKQPQKAIEVLKNITKKHNIYTPEVDLLLAENYNQIGQKWHASMCYADYSIKKGDLQAALMQLKASQKYDNLNDYQQKMITYRIKDLEQKYQNRKAKLKQWL